MHSDEPGDALIPGEIRIRRIERHDDDVVALVAERMRETLVEVLGAERGTAMYDREWLRDRVRAHLDPARLDGAGFVAGDCGTPDGHLLARPEVEDGRPIGMIATVYVAPSARRRGVASALFDAGEAWLRARGLAESAYDTALDNAPMLALLAARGYVETRRDVTKGMLRLSRRPAAGS